MRPGPKTLTKECARGIDKSFRGMSASHPISDIGLVELNSQMHTLLMPTHLIIHGRVQGVFYRDWTVRTARQLGLNGWVRNLPDGTVEAHLEGPSDAVEAMIGKLHDGPPAARVDCIERREAGAQGFAGFERR